MSETPKQGGPVKTSLRMKLVLIFVPTLVLFLLAEVAVRGYVWYAYGRHDHGLRWEFSYEPYLLVKKRDKMSQVYPPKGEQIRILLLGGSTANQIPDDMLREAFGAYSDREVEIINLAQDGYILNQERIMLVLYGMRLDPDLIITIDGVNDFVTASKGIEPGITYHDAFIETAVEKPLRNAVYSVFKRSQLVNALNKLLERSRERDFQGLDEDREAVRAHLIECWGSIATIADGLDCRYMMVLQPFIHMRETISERETTLTSRYDYRKDYLTEMFTTTSQRMGRETWPDEVLVVDGTTAFDEIPSDVECFRDEVHLTENGNERFTRFLAKMAHDNGLVASLAVTE